MLERLRPAAQPECYLVNRMKPIETEYNGDLFRSRLEARWAVFFRTLNLRYEYEKEGFDIDGVRYLPDFFLPEYSCWVEIKPDSISEKEYIKINAFAKATKDKFILISGSPKEGHYTVQMLANGNLDTELLENLPADDFTFALARRSSEPELCLLCEYCAFNLISKSTDDGERWPITTGLEIAYNAASQERFENR